MNRRELLDDAPVQSRKTLRFAGEAINKRLEKRRQRRQYHAELFRLCDRIFEEHIADEDLVKPLGDNKQYMILENADDGWITIERSLAKDSDNKVHYIHWGNAAFYGQDEDGEERTATIRLDKTSMALVPRHMVNADFLDRKANPGDSYWPKSISLEQARHLANEMENIRLLLLPEDGTTDLNNLPT